MMKKGQRKLFSFISDGVPVEGSPGVSIWLSGQENKARNCAPYPRAAGGARHHLQLHSQ